MVRRAMLFAGLVAVAGFVGITVIGAEMIPGYSHFSNPISQMTEEGADSKACLDPWFILFDFMVVAFASALPGSVSPRNDGVRMHAERGRRLSCPCGVPGDNHDTVASNERLCVDRDCNRDPSRAGCVCRYDQLYSGHSLLWSEFSDQP